MPNSGDEASYSMLQAVAVHLWLLPVLLLLEHGTAPLAGALQRQPLRRPHKRPDSLRELPSTLGKCFVDPSSDCWTLPHLTEPLSLLGHAVRPCCLSPLGVLSISGPAHSVLCHSWPWKQPVPPILLHGPWRQLQMRQLFPVQLELPARPPSFSPPTWCKRLLCCRTLLVLGTSRSLFYFSLLHWEGRAAPPHLPITNHLVP